MSKAFILPLMLAIACAPKPQSTDATMTFGAEDSSTSRVSSDTVGPVPPASGSLTTEPVVHDSSLYIGEVGSFPETGELHTPVYYHSHLNLDGLFDTLVKQADSVVYQDIERRRSRIPTSMARIYFNLSGLDTISIYKMAHFVGKAKLVRVEYFQDLIEGKFVAVFKPIGLSTLPDALDYCISGGRNRYKTTDVTCENIEDQQLTQNLLERFVEDSVRVRDVSHTRIMPQESVYSSISMHSRLLLVETKEGKSQILKDLKEDWFISDILPLHLEYNGKPILLLTMRINETDMMWTSLAVFDEGEYVFPENNRLENGF